MSHRVGLWEERNEQSLIGLNVSTLAKDSVVSTMYNLSLSRLRFTEIYGNDHIIERAASNIKQLPADSVLFCLLLEGNAFYYHQDGFETLGSGDAILYDADRPFMYGFHTPMRQLILEMPRDVFRENTGSSSPGRPRVLRGSGSGAADEHVRTLARVIQGTLRSKAAPEPLLEDEALDLFGLLIGSNAGPPGQAYLLAAKGFIGRNFHRPDLTTSSIARAVGISDRHLARVFAAEESSVARFVMDTRLERAYRLLTETTSGHVQVRDIAASVGFVSAAHFSRAFRNKFGFTAREARDRGRARRP
ncbi:helix-turn-helix domain-containing protein [Arthrobacter sp. ISL-5]|uniref:helix-turn-helix domain-containing protein n=1 Tax=Arthrobacter sp. ISL-5 TaxID=2819111 RepID=UPI001BED1F36|nr:helix-turn-helix domain-containing protein [Arthrobacter sp. ISL-5]MBT2556021.1 helix-turn-helix domain-containing protein [Arthrobacter sp. ISL-5]